MRRKLGKREIVVVVVVVVVVVIVEKNNVCNCCGSIRYNNGLVGWLVGWLVKENKRRGKR